MTCLKNNELGFLLQYGSYILAIRYDNKKLL